MEYWAKQIKNKCLFKLNRNRVEKSARNFLGVIVRIFQNNFFPKFLIINFSLLFLINFINAEPPSFVIKKETTRGKNKSKTELKENIGGEIKNVLHKCAHVNKQLGEMQIELSKMQKQLFDKVEELIDNKKPFKKASREQLNKTLNVVNNVNVKLSEQSGIINQIKNQINKDICLKQS